MKRRNDKKRNDKNKPVIIVAEPWPLMVGASDPALREKQIKDWRKLSYVPRYRKSSVPPKT
jgi:hypothetical protein